ncbi:MAG: YdbH domain-containing protein, partial [Deltaproteobacteria bacterium]|jgi:hypothetical protein|nr:YdbH domain-containing protein [Deltaproteobacteria bacterium]
MEQLRLSGLTLYLEPVEGRLSLRGLDLFNRFSPETELAEQQKENFVLPVVPERLMVSDGRLVISRGTHSFLFPFALELINQAGKGEMPVYRLNLEIMGTGQELFLTGVIDLATGTSSLSLRADALDVNRLIDAFGLEKSEIYPGKVNIQGKAEFAVAPFQFVSASLSIAPFALSLGKVPVRFGGRPDGEGKSIDLKLETAGKQLLLTVESVLQEPVQAELDVTASISREEATVRGTGNFILRGSGRPDPENAGPFFIHLQNDPGLAAEFNFAAEESGRWQAEMASALQELQQGKPEAFKAGFDSLRLQAEAPRFTVLGHGTAEGREIEATISLPGLTATSDKAETTVKKVSLQATFRQEEAGKGRSSSSSKLSLQLGGASFQQDNVSAGADISLEAAIAHPAAGGNMPLAAAGTVFLNRGTLAARASGVRLANIQGEIPLAWPTAGATMTGHLEIPAIWWRGHDLGRGRADITLRDTQYSLDGLYSSRLLQGVDAAISGTALVDGYDSHGELTLQATGASFAPVDLGIIASALENSFLSGEIGVDTSLSFARQGMSGALQLSLQNGIFEFPDKNYRVGDIEARLHMPSLPALYTAPAQILRIGEAVLGSLVFNSGNLVWQLESPTSIFVEEAMLQWSGGRVFSNSVRLSAGDGEFVVPIFCDRLRLAEILRQLGFANAEGEGTVSGRIPMRIANRSVTFADGFLYSSPGQGGSIKVAAFDLLSANIPKNTAQFAQVDFAAAALKNFQYNWVKLFLDSEGEDLLMQMQMDGRPVQSLPFSYDSLTGQLRRIPDGGRGIDHPIRLDVNFRLPLNRFLGYSGRLQDILENIQ